MIPLNEYPKEELEILYRSLIHRLNFLNVGNKFGIHEYNISAKWIKIIREAISDQEFKERQLPFDDECGHYVKVTIDGITKCDLCHKELPFKTE